MNVVWTIALGIFGAIALGFLLMPQIVYWQIKHIKKANTIRI
jgi:hypothetical protein